MTELTALWPQTIRLEAVGRPGREAALQRRLFADEAARATIAKALDLVSLDSLEADLTMRAWFDGVEIEAEWRARIVQICGVSLDPFATDLDGEFKVRAVPQGSPHAQALDSEVVVDPDADDPPDVLDSDVVDLGAYVIEHLALEIDPFPRAPDAVFEAPEPSEETSPFAVLRALKPRDGRQ